MRKPYIKPSITVASIVTTSLVCYSITGVSRTGSLNADIAPNETTDEYLSRRSNNAWDNED